MLMQQSGKKMKWCPKCKSWKELSEFYKVGSGKDELRCQCKDCCRKAHREYLQTDEGRAAKRKYRQSERGKEAVRINSRKRRRLCPEKAKARSDVSNAIRDGKLIRPSHCESCFEERFAESHHEDYSKTLDVDWLCKKCHRELNRKEARICGS